MENHRAAINSAREIYIAARKLADNAKRASYLDEACGNDMEVRNQVDRLLAACDAESLNVLDEVVSLLQPRETSATNCQPPSANDISRHPKIGSYKLLDRLGEGGMGEVFVAEQTHPVRRLVALKLIKRGMDTQDVIARFEAERQALALMNHSNIARVLEAGETDDGRPYFVMDLVRGIPITEYCDERQLTTRERLALLVKVCEAVQHAHLKGVIHRDLKPSNVLVELHDVDHVPKIIDFGVAKATNQRLTERTLFTNLSQMIGTPLYMSPEQAELSGLDVDTRSDVYSLGVLIYELLTGTTPIERSELISSGLDEVRRIIREVDPPRPSHKISTLNNELASTVSTRRRTNIHDLSLSMKRELDWIVMKALEKDRTRRYESANALADDIRRYLRDEPVHACPPSTLYALGKFTRRHRGLATAAAALGVFVLIATCLLWNERSQTFAALASETKQRRLAEEQRTIAQQQERLAQRQQELAQEQRDQAHRNLYRADMRLVLSDVNRGNNAGLFRKLTDYVPRESNPEHRNWEWYFALAQTQQHERAMYGHTSHVGWASWSPDGQHIASASHDGSVIVWSTSSWQPVRNFPHDLAFKRGVVWSAGGKQLAWGSASHSIRVWEVETNKLRKLDAHTDSARALAFSPDGLRLATGSEDAVIVWDVASGDILERFNPQTTDATVETRPARGPSFAYANSKGVKVWEWDSLKLMMLHSGHYEWHAKTCWNPDGDQLIVGEPDESNLVLINTKSRQVSRLDCGRGKFAAVGWSSDGRIATGDDGGNIEIWDVASRKLLKTLRGHRGTVGAISWSPDGQSLVSAGASDRSLRIWHLDAQAPLREYKAGKSGRSQLSWTGDSSLVISNRNRVYCTDADSGDVSLDLHFKQGREVHARISPNGQFLAVLVPGEGECLDLKLRDVQSNQVTRTISTAVRPDYHARLKWSPDSRLVAVGGNLSSDKDYPGSVEVWQVDDGQRLFRIRRRTQGRGNGNVCFSPDSRLLAFEDDGPDKFYSHVRIFDVADGTQVRELGHSRHDQVRALAWATARDLLATATSTGKIYLWNVEDSEPVEIVEGHASEVTCLDWSPDGRRLCSGAADSTIKIWDNLGNELLTFAEHDALIFEVCWSPDGKRLASVAKGGRLFLHDASHGYQLSASGLFNQEWSERLYDEAKSYKESGDLESAVVKLSKAVTLIPDNHRALHLRGACHYRLGQLVNAERDDRAAVAIHPDNPWYSYSLGQVYEKKRHFEAALREYSRVIDMNLEFSLFHQVRGNLHARLHRWQEAETDYGGIGKEHEPDVRYRLALLHLRKNKLLQYRQSCEEWRSRLLEKTSPPNREECYWFTWTCALAEDALEDYLQAIEWARLALPAADDAGRNALAALLVRAEQNQEAIELLEDLTVGWKHSEPKSYSPAYTRYFLAMAHHQAGNTHEARQWLQEADQSSSTELANDDLPWNRRITIELLRDEAEALVNR